MTKCEPLVILYFHPSYFSFIRVCIALRDLTGSIWFASSGSAVSRAVTACYVVRMTLIHATLHPSCYHGPVPYLISTLPLVRSLSGIVNTTSVVVTMITRYAIITVYYYDILTKCPTMYIFITTELCPLYVLYVYVPPQQSIR